MLDEFGLLGHFEVFAEAMSHMAGFGLRACLAVQSFNQIYEAYGRHETITNNCDTTVRFTPNNLATAEEISRQIGQTSVRHQHRTQAGDGGSVSEPEVGRPLMTPDEVRRMSTEEVLIFARGQRPIRAPLLQYHEQRYFKRLAAIKPPATSDRTITAPPAEGVREKEQAMRSASGKQCSRRSASAAEPPAGENSVPKVKFLSFAAGSAAAKVQGQ